MTALVPGSAVLFGAATIVTLNYHDPPTAVRSPVSVPKPVWLPVMIGALGVVLAVVLASGASVIVRYRAGDERTRQQLRWLLLAAGSVVGLMVGSWAVTALGWAENEAYIGFLAGIVVLVPAAVAVAVLRYDLFEIDRLLADSAAWLLTTVVAAGALAGCVVGLDRLLGPGSPVSRPPSRLTHQHPHTPTRRVTAPGTVTEGLIARSWPGDGSGLPCFRARAATGLYRVCAVRPPSGATMRDFGRHPAT